MKTIENLFQVEVKTNRRKISPKKEDPAEDADYGLFSMDQEFPLNEIQDVCGIIANHQSILSRTRQNTKTWNSIFNEMHKIVEGTFIYAHQWDQAWVSKLTAHFPVETIKFSWDELVRKCDEILRYVEERSSRGFWWPSRKDGRVVKSSLADFIVSTMRSGKCWSPFLELCVSDCITPSMYRQRFGQAISSIVDDILKDVWFSIDFDTEVKFFKGIERLYCWYKANSLELRKKSAENALMFRSYAYFLDNVLEANKATKCIGPYFIDPSSSKWEVLKSWMKNERGVTI